MEHLTWHRDLISGRVRNFGCWKEWGEGVGACTLLGPEGPDALAPSGVKHLVTLGLLLFAWLGKR